MYSVTQGQTPQPVSGGWGNTWAKRGRDPSRDAGPALPRPDPRTRTPGPCRGGRCAGPRTAGAGGRKLPPPRPAPPRREGAEARGREGTRVYKQGGGSAGGSAPREGEGCRARGPRFAGPLAGHSPRPLSPIPSRPVSPGSGSGVCCSPAAAAAAAAAGSSQGRRRRHRDATPQCISFRTPTGPHCPAACRWGRKGGRAAQDMTPG